MFVDRDTKGGCDIETPARPIELQELFSLLKIFEPRLKDGTCGIAPASFEAADDRTYPRTLPIEWPTAARTLSVVKAPGIMMRLPLLWQLEGALFRAGQTVGAPLFVNDVDNMPLGAAAIEHSSMDTVVTTGSDARAFAAFIVGAQKTPPRAWLIVHPIDAAWEMPSTPAQWVCQEVHLMPGYPVLVQCEELAAQRVQRFHAPSTCTISKAGDRALFSGRPLGAFPIRSLILPIPLREDGVCACGETVWTKAL